MSDRTNIDNPSAASTGMAPKIDRWAWLKNIPKKILGKSSIPLEQVNNLGEVSSVATPAHPQVINEEPKEELKQGEQQETELEVDTPPLTTEEKPEEVPITSRISSTGRILQEEIARLNMEVPEIETKGMPAIIGTNEAIGSGFFEAVQAKHQNGYLVGVGSGSAYSMLHVFEDGIIPRGIVLADIDPRAVAIGRLLIQNLKNSSTAADFQKNFFGMSEDTFNQQRLRMIADEQNSALKRRWEVTNADTWHRVWTDLSKREVFEWEDIRAYKYEGQNIDVVGAVLAKFDVLKQLADEDNITMIYADFTNSDFIEAVKKLPGFDSSTNVIYFSNIADHITNRGTQMENVSAMDSLKAYEDSVHPTIFIDTLGQGLNYFLRARNSLAEFTEDDFRYRGLIPRSQKPGGLLFADFAS